MSYFIYWYRLFLELVALLDIDIAVSLSNTIVSPLCTVTSSFTATIARLLRCLKSSTLASVSSDSSIFSTSSKTVLSLFVSLVLFSGSFSIESVVSLDTCSSDSISSLFSEDSVGRIVVVSSGELSSSEP
ncbi:hypothetical protein O0550_10805 [Brevibacillus halotolerans]|uniref:hypothetical protein n=1 Tax=Brevibacillus TaxID=55080 RepID=UPI00215D4CBD|nr:MULTISPECIES: hypothetical protein [Brevibacillus]MCR8963687.1 hypothetical protein [Brevibacillus laterosporus]MCZ0835843.1 hypothetical protein [Brevibacillus halotolerans]